MKRNLLAATIFLTAIAVAQSPPKRPKITGIDHVDFYTTDAQANERFYNTVLGIPLAKPVESGQTERFIVGAQWVGYSPAPHPQSTDRMDHVAFRTDDCLALRSYLAANGVKVSQSCATSNDGNRSFAVNDPDGHKIEFGQDAKFQRLQSASGDSVSRRLIHAGFIVHDRAAEDHFYKDILGFRPYWHGGMQNDRDDWVAMQVPDGTDWVEYMLNIKPDADQRTTGVMNHVSLSVKDIKAAQAKLEARGWKANDREHAQMGRDGKWQLNMYDPDQTRIELMEFTPAEKPCCSDFQGRHPSE